MIIDQTISVTQQLYMIVKGAVYHQELGFENSFGVTQDVNG